MQNNKVDSQRTWGEIWLLITHSNNRMKKAFINMKISDALNLGLNVE
jgi:hypothetical protein